MARGKKKEELSLEEKLEQALVPVKEQPYEVPGNWCWVRLGKLYEINPKITANDAVLASFIPMERIEAGMTGRFTFEIQPWGKARKNHTQFADGDVAFAKISPCFENQKSMVLQGLMNGIGGGTTELIVLRQAHMNQKYTFLLVSTEDFISRGRATYSGTVGQQRISMDFIKTYPVPVPPLAEQHRIVKRVESLFAKLDAVKEKVSDVVQQSEIRRLTLVNHLFTGEFVGIKDAYTIPLFDIVEEIKIGPFGNSLHKEDYIVNGIPVINPKHINKQGINPDKEVSITSKKARELSSYVLKENDIIMGRRGEMGRTAPVSQKEEGYICGTGSLIIRLKKEFRADLYSQILKSQSVINHLEQNCVGSTMKNLNEKIVKQIPVPHFTKEQQDILMFRFETMLKKEQQLLDKLDGIVDAISLIKKAILIKAFRGELGTNKPEEQPAIETIRTILME